MSRVKAGRHRRRQRRWLVLGVALVTVVAGEAVVRARESVLPRPPTWFGPEMPIKEQQIGALQARGGASVVAVGSSTVDVSVDPSQMAPPPWGRPAYNAATGAGSLRMIDIWSRYVAIPRLQPDVVIFGIVSREMNPNDPAQRGNEQEFFAAPAVEELLGTESRIEVVERHVSEASRLFEYRKIIRQPENLERMLGLKKNVSGRTYGDIIADDGQFEGFLDRPFTYNENVAREVRNRALNDFDIGPVQLQTLRTLLTYLDTNVPHVIVVNMPVTQQYVDAHPKGQADYDRFVAMLAAEVAKVDVTYVDTGIWSSDLFADPAHLNRAGAKQLTALLDAEVAKMVPQ